MVHVLAVVAHEVVANQVGLVLFVGRIRDDRRAEEEAGGVAQVVEGDSDGSGRRPLVRGKPGGGDSGRPGEDDDAGCTVENGTQVAHPEAFILK